MPLATAKSQRVCRLSGKGQLGDEQHILLECPALSDIRAELADKITQSSAVMARLVWAEDQARIGRYIAAGLNRLQRNQTCR